MASSVEASSEGATGAAPVKAGEFRLEVVVLPVSDVGRAKEFYVGLGWRLDADVAPAEARASFRSHPRALGARSNLART
jgi:hypothetical protein